MVAEALGKAGPRYRTGLSTAWCRHSPRELLLFGQFCWTMFWRICEEIGFHGFSGSHGEAHEGQDLRQISDGRMTTNTVERKTFLRLLLNGALSDTLGSFIQVAEQCLHQIRGMLLAE